jgi:hypothetical protein
MRQRPQMVDQAPWDRIERFAALASERGLGMLEATIGWLLSRPALSSVIAGATSVEQIAQNAAAADAWRPAADELNLIEKGKNYGWPVITYGINYDGTPITDIQEKEGMEQPKHYWVPSIATCGVAVVTSDKYPAWKGNILVAALAKQHIARVEMNGTSYVKEEKLLQDIGRVRQVAESPEGYIYAITEATGLLVKLLPIR